MVSSLVAQVVQNLPAMPETWVQSLGWEDPLEKGMATHSGVAWRIPETEEPGRLQSMGLHWDPHTWVSLVAQVVQNLPAMQDTQVRFQGWEDSLEKE